jgi:hypothetical protein
MAITGESPQFYPHLDAQASKKLFMGGERFHVPTLPFGIQSNARDDFPEPKDQYDYQFFRGMETSIFFRL